MSVTYLNYNASGTEIIDEALVINTAGSQQLVHDHVISIEVWTGEGKTGSQLIASTDYVLGDYDSFYKTYNSITFLTHNGDTVYCTYLTKGDKNSADDVNSKADKVASPTAGNFAGLDANGNLTDSTSKASDFATSGHVHSAATTAVDGFMSAADKTKMNSITDFGLGLVAAADAAAGRTALGALGTANIYDGIRDSQTSTAPTENAVYDALAAKAPLDSPTFIGTRVRSNFAQIIYSNPLNYNHAYYINNMESTNMLFGADKRLSISHSDIDPGAVTSYTYANLFDQNFSSYGFSIAADKTAEITITIPSVSYALGIYTITFRWGYVPETIKLEVYGTYDGAAGTWVEVTATPIYASNNHTVIFKYEDNKMRDFTKIRFTLTAKSSGGCSVSQIEAFIDYWSTGEKQMFNKAQVNTLTKNVVLRGASDTTGMIIPSTGALQIAKIYPVANSTTALQLTKADGTTPVLTTDTTNTRIGIGKTPTEPLDVAGNIKGSGYLELNEISEPSAGAADTARLYAVANGSLTDIRVRANGEAGQRIALCGRENTFTKTQGFDIVNIGNSGTSKTIDWTAGNKQKMTLTGNCEVSFTDPSGSAPLELRLIQDTTGGRTVTWSGMTLKWEGGIAATLTAASNAIDIVEFTYDSGEDTYYGSCKNDFKASA